MTLDVAWWQAILGLMMAVGGVAGMVGLMLRLWMQPQVGEWIEIAMRRERAHSDEQMALIRDSLTRCQAGRGEWRGGIERQVDTAERRLEKAIDDIKNKIDDVVEQLTGVREHLARLTGEVRQNGKAAL